ncbi:MAG: alpha/beta hydrolase family protein [Planctomycetaceae bacterium]
MQLRRQIMMLGGLLIALQCHGVRSVAAQDWSLSNHPALAAYFESEVGELEQQNELTRYKDLAEWEAAKPTLRGELFDMLGLYPLPDRSPLQAEVTGIAEETEFIVEKVHFQSLPGLYVTGNFYLPRKVEGPLPTVLYVCGHASVKKDNVSLGNKTAYQHHGAWFARNGYACLIIDTLQLGEIEGVHHGTYRMNRWWWNSRGYTSAGVEAWNCIRALDYLETRPEVDATRVGVTGRSGGGAYSWWLAALDDRIACAVPVAGITSLRNHVIDGCVEGHCDCMYMVNTHRWDFAKVAALVAPRPLLISNTDKDRIFPLEGVVDVHRQVRHIYRLHEAGDKLGLQITEGPHQDTQELHIHAFRWFNRFLKQDRSMIEKVASKFFEPEQLQVFATLPADQVNTRVDETFVPAATLPAVETVLADPNAWFADRLNRLRDRCFKAWPEDEQLPPVRQENLPTELTAGSKGETLQKNRIHFQSEPNVELFLDILCSPGQPPAKLTSAILLVAEDPDGAVEAALREGWEASTGLVVFSPRGAGPHAWGGSDAKQIQILRRFQLIGTTVDSMQVWDIRRAMQAVAEVCPQVGNSLSFHTAPRFEVHSLIASLFERPVSSHRVSLADADPSRWPAVLNLTRTIAPQELVAMASLRSEIEAASTSTPLFGFVQELAKDGRWPGQSLGETAR